MVMVVLWWFLRVVCLPLPRWFVCRCNATVVLRVVCLPLYCAAVVCSFVFELSFLYCVV